MLDNGGKSKSDQQTLPTSPTRTKRLLICRAYSFLNVGAYDLGYRGTTERTVTKGDTPLYTGNHALITVYAIRCIHRYCNININL